MVFPRNAPGGYLGAMKSTYQIDPAHSTAQFAIRHLMISNVRGGFSGVQGTMTYDPEARAISSVEATIDAGTISTQNGERDAHLKSADFFDVAKFPSFTFKAGSATPDGDRAVQLKGELTLHGVTRPVVLKVQGPSNEQKDPWKNTRVGVSARTTIKRSDFGLTWNSALESGGVLVGDDIQIELDVSLVKSA